MKKIQFHYADRKLNLAQKNHIKSFIETIFKKEKKKLKGLSYVFCSDEYLLQINRDFLQHDYYTDIITFDLSENEGIQGEIYISTDRVKENAATEGVSFKEEMLRVIFHGALHLCGFKDKLSAEVKLMRNKENLYLRLYKEQ